MEYDPEAFSLEYEEFEQACREDAENWQFWNDLGFEEDNSFQLGILFGRSDEDAKQ